MRRIAHDLVEINDVIEVARSADPGVHGLAVRFIHRAWLVVVRSHERRHGGADYLHTVSMGARDELLVGTDHAPDLSLVLRE